MERTIWKFEIPEAEKSIVKMPKGHTTLTAQQQYSTVKIWAVVDPTEDMVDTTFYLIGTGNKMPEVANLKYVGTIQSYAGSQVHHLFEEINI